MLKQWLKPVDDAVIFPPTYANPSQRKGDPPVYNIDRFGETVKLGKKFTKYEKTHTFMDDSRTEEGKEHSVCVIDSIPSQANRIEPAFGRMTDKEGKPVRLVPKVIITAIVDGKEEQKDLLEAGHRAADAIVQLSATGRSDECHQGKTAGRFRSPGETGTDLAPVRHVGFARIGRESPALD